MDGWMGGWVDAEMASQNGMPCVITLRNTSALGLRSNKMVELRANRVVSRHTATIDASHW